MAPSLIPTLEQPVVFFPGTLCDERIFAPCWQHVHINQRAFVPLQWAENLSQMLMLSQDRLAYFSQPVHLVGYSMGGYIAALTALQHPEMVASVTLIASACNALPAPQLTQTEQVLTLIQQKKYMGVTDTYLSSLFYPTNSNNTAAKLLIKQMRQDLGYPSLAAQLRATHPRQDLIPGLAKANLPIHIIVAEQDCLVSQQTAMAMHKALGNSQLSIIPEAGHMLPLEQPQLLAGSIAKYLG